MMRTLVIYCDANGIFGSRRIERATYRDVAVRYLTADTPPDHDTICAFRRGHFEAVSAAFLEVLKRAHELKLLKVGTISLDGTHIKANGSTYQALSYERAGELERQLKLEIEPLLAQAEQADATAAVDGQTRPEEIARREALRQKVAAARRRIEPRAAARAEAERADDEQTRQDREARPGPRKGPPPSPPDPTPEPREQINLTDEDSRIMRQSSRREYQQAYNVRRLFALATT